MINREALKKIADIIEIGRANDHFPCYTARTVIETLEKLGYLKEAQCKTKEKP